MVGVKNPSYREYIPKWETYLKLKPKTAQLEIV
jgi:hypothetical protein